MPISLHELDTHRFARIVVGLELVKNLIDKMVYPRDCGELNASQDGAFE